MYSPSGLHFTSVAALLMFSTTTCGFHSLAAASKIHTKAFRSCAQVTSRFVRGHQSMPVITKSCCKWIIDKHTIVSMRATGGREETL